MNVADLLAEEAYYRERAERHRLGSPTPSSSGAARVRGGDRGHGRASRRDGEDKNLFDTAPQAGQGPAAETRVASSAAANVPMESFIDF